MECTSFPSPCGSTPSEPRCSGTTVPRRGATGSTTRSTSKLLATPDAAVDAELIELALRLFQGLGLTGTKLVLNSIGDRDTRPAYLKALRDYYKPLIDKMGADCARRYDTNVLRLLDCKTEICQEYAVDAPRSIDHLGGDGLVHWESLLDHLARLGIEYEVDHRLVRGLDYYTRTVFEVQPPVEGAQSSMGGGGRYDGLMEELGGRATPAVGFACGIERIILNLKRQEIEPGPPLSDPVIMVAFVGRGSPWGRRQAHFRAQASRAASVACASGEKPEGADAARRLRGRYPHPDPW